MRFTRVSLLTSMVFAVAFLAGPGWAQSLPSGGEEGTRPTFETTADAPEVVLGRIIVKFEEDATQVEKADARRDEELGKVEELGLIDAEAAKVGGQYVDQAIRDLERRPDVEYAEPDRFSYLAGYADEPRFGELWGLNNTGQTVGGSTGVVDVDVDGLEASAVTQGDPNLVVAVIDSGVDFTHPDLADRAWVNPGESGGGKETNGVDDDGNGYVDDVNGWNFCNDTPKATANVTATFSEAMDKESLTGATFTLVKRSTGEHVDASVRYVPSVNRAVLHPTDDLVPGAAYVATVESGPDGVKDASENALAEDEVWTFRVNGAPKIEILDPEPGCKTTSRRPAIRAVVRDGQTALSSSDITLTLDGEGIADFTYSRSTGVLRFVPPADLPYGRHEVRIEARDRQGLSTTRSWGFGVVR